MRLSSGTLYHSVVLVVRCTLVTSLPRTGQLYRPVEYVDFSLLPATSPGASSDLAAVRYDLMSAGGGREREGALPLLSRGVRDITNDEEEEEEDSVRVPSCSELRRMWKIARRIHQRAIRTNEIPQQLPDPFSSFESDRFRTARRQHRTRTRGDKERVTEAGNYGTVRYSPSDPVKRPGSGVYDVLRKLNPEVKYSDTKSSGAWNTGIVEFEPERLEQRPFDKLRNKLRREKQLPELPDKQTSVSKSYWGNVISHYKKKGRARTSNLDKVRAELVGAGRGGGGNTSRLNYRDESSGPIQTGGLVPRTTFSRNLARTRQLRQKHKKERKKMKQIQKELADKLKNQLMSKRRKHRNQGRKKFRENSNQNPSSNHLQNFLMKG